MASPSKALVDPTAGTSLIIPGSIRDFACIARIMQPSSIQVLGFTGLSTVIPLHTGTIVLNNARTKIPTSLGMQRLGTFPPIYKENPATGGGGGGTGPTQGQMYPRIADPTYG